MSQSFPHTLQPNAIFPSQFHMINPGLQLPHTTPVQFAQIPQLSQFPGNTYGANVGVNPYRNRNFPGLDPTQLQLQAAAAAVSTHIPQLATSQVGGGVGSSLHSTQSLATYPTSIMHSAQVQAHAQAQQNHQVDLNNKVLKRSLADVGLDNDLSKRSRMDINDLVSPRLSMVLGNDLQNNILERSKKISRGKYKCSRCNQPKTNHVCVVADDLVLTYSVETQTEPPSIGATEKTIVIKKYVPSN